jgi:redox-sensitive bicupin YhaK (pirin superfamily)
MAILSNDTQANGVLLQGHAGDQLLVLSGQPLKEPIVQWGPFVMNTRDEIEQAISDYQSGQL